MPEGPFLINEESFQQAWISAAKKLEVFQWEIKNLMVTIQDSTLFSKALHQKFTKFAEDNDILNPKAVAYTIFPHKLYQTYGDAERLFVAYNRPRGFYERIKRPHEWGTYFRRMTHYEKTSNVENQLFNVINAINIRERISSSAYTVVIQKPGGETIRPLGGPCLNYLAIQLDRSKNKLGILAVYRNHDFFVRAYGNYWGLCNLINFMAKETNFSSGHLTCVSSHVYLNGNKRNFKRLLDSLP